MLDVPRERESERSIKRMIHSIADKFHSPDVINQSQLEWRGHAREKPSFILRVSPGPYLSLQTFPHTRRGAFFINGSLFLLNWRKNRTPDSGPEFTRSHQSGTHTSVQTCPHTHSHIWVKTEIKRKLNFLIKRSVEFFSSPFFAFVQISWCAAKQYNRAKSGVNKVLNGYLCDVWKSSFKAK